MATESTPLKRVFRAAAEAPNLYLLLPSFGLLLIQLFVPKDLETYSQVAAVNFIATLLLISGIVCLVFFFGNALSAGFNECRYGEAMRRTGLTWQQISQLLRMVPYQLKSPWQVARQMRAEWSLQEFLDFYKEGKLKIARDRLSGDVVACSVCMIKAQHDGSGFDEDAFMDDAKQKYLAEKRRIMSLTSIPD